MIILILIFVTRLFTIFGKNKKKFLECAKIKKSTLTVNIQMGAEKAGKYISHIPIFK